MAKSPGEMIAAVKKNLPSKTGRSFEAWVELAKAQQRTKRSELVGVLKSDHGLGHVTAALIADEALEPGSSRVYEDGEALVAQLYAGERAKLRSLHDRLVGLARGLGGDVRAVPCRTYVPLLRGKQFAVLKPGRDHVLLGLALGAVRTGGRLEGASRLGSERITHAVRVSRPGEIDAELKGWLKQAYAGAATDGGARPGAARRSASPRGSPRR